MSVTILQGDWIEQLKTLLDESVHCCVTSPPYWGLRDYGVPGQLGLEKTPDFYVAKLVEGFREVRRVLREDGTLWLNLGDSYAGYWGEKYAHKPFGKDRTPDASTPPHKPTPDWVKMGLKPKDLCGIPWRVAFALQADGWWLRSDIIWHKPNPMPESVTDRPTKAHEYIFLLTKSDCYFYDAEAIKDPVSGTAHKRQPMNGRPASMAFKMEAAGKGNRNNPSFQSYMQDLDPELGRNKRTVWTVPSQAYPGSHFATFPEDLIKPCILAGCPVGDTVLDPFAGSGTTGQVALELGRKAILIELNPEYVRLIEKRTHVTPGLALA